MSTVREMFELRKVVTNKTESDALAYHRNIGVEVELERAHKMLAEMEGSKFWDGKGDGSLRYQGVEFVFKRPLAGALVDSALEELCAAGEKTNPDANVNCSTHVHIDFSEAETQEVINFIATYMLVEDALADFCGPNRKDNLYCLTFSNAEFATEVVNNIITRNSLTPIARAREGDLKYSALNMYTLRKFGTLEVRLAPAMYKADELRHWINLLLSILKFSKTIDTPADVLTQVSHLGIHGFCQEVLGDGYESIRPYINEENVWCAIDRLQYALVNY